MRLLGGTPHFVVGSITLKSSLMDPVNGKWKIEFLALSPMSKYGLPRLAMAIPRLMPTSGTLFMVCYVCMVCMYVCTECPKKRWFKPMPISAMCISETTASPQNNVCNVAPQDRRDCGGGGDTIADCLRKGCCHDSSIRGVIWCFYKEGEKFSI